MRGERALSAVHHHEAAPALRVVIACPLARQDGPRMLDAIRGRALLHLVDTLADVQRLLATLAGPVAVVIVPSRDATGESSVHLVERVAHQFPDVAIVAHCRAGIEHSADIRALAVAGVHEFMFAGIDDCGVALRAVLKTAVRECAGARVLRHALACVPDRLHAFVECCVLQPLLAKSVSSVADLLGVNRRTLTSYCTQEGLPAPIELITWCRLMLAADLLGRTGRTVESIALELDFPSDTSLRNAMKRYTGLRAVEVRNAGGLACVLRAFSRTEISARRGVQGGEDDAGHDHRIAV